MKRKNCVSIDKCFEYGQQLKHTQRLVLYYISIEIGLLIIILLIIIVYRLIIAGALITWVYKISLIVTCAGFGTKRIIGLTTEVYYKFYFPVDFRVTRSVLSKNFCILIIIFPFASKHPIQEHYQHYR